MNTKKVIGFFQMLPVINEHVMELEIRKVRHSQRLQRIPSPTLTPIVSRLIKREIINKLEDDGLDIII